MKNKILLFLFSVTALLSLYPDSSEPSENPITWVLSEEDWRPIFYNDELSLDNSIYGFWADVVKELFVQRLNMKLEIKRLPWVRGQLEIKNGESDFMITIPTAERETYTLVTDEPILNLYMQIFTYAGHDMLEEIQKIQSVHDILRMGLIPVTNLGNGWHAEHIDSYGVKTEHIRTDESLAKVLANRRVDILIDAPLTMSLQINKLGLSSQILMTDAILDQTDFHVLVSKKSPLINHMIDINRVLHEMIIDGTIDLIYGKYINGE